MVHDSFEYIQGGNGSSNSMRTGKDNLALGEERKRRRGEESLTNTPLSDLSDNIYTLDELLRNT